MMDVIAAPSELHAHFSKKPRRHELLDGDGIPELPLRALEHDEGCLERFKLAPQSIVGMVRVHKQPQMLMAPSINWKGGQG